MELQVLQHLLFHYSLEVGYDKAAILIMIFSPMLVLQGIENVIGTQYLLPTKRQKEYTISVAIGVLTNLILNYIFVFLEGMLSFLSPCVLPLLPVYISYLAGNGKEVDENGNIKYIRKKVFLNTILFIMSFPSAIGF